MDELIDTVGIIGISDGVRTRLTGAPSVTETETVSNSIINGDKGAVFCVVGVATLVGDITGSGIDESCRGRG